MLVVVVVVVGVTIAAEDSGLDGIKGLLRVESWLTPILHTNQEQTLFFIEITGIFGTEIYYTILT